MDLQEFTHRIFSVGTPSGFNQLALEAFGFQREHCAVYRDYLKLTGKEDFIPSTVEQIPFLPIRLFKSCNVVSDWENPAITSEKATVFTSSATTGMVPSHHEVKDIRLYERSFSEAFRLFYGESGSYNLLALLPSYLERKGSSLVYMADKLISSTKANGREGGFFLYDHDNLLETVRRLNGPTILLGVSFALLDFALFVKEQIPDQAMRKDMFRNVTVMETGGMKGRGQELSRKELHRRLREGLCTESIHSEYGMCELLSQAYSFDDNGVFFTPPWMKVLTRDLQDPFRILGKENVQGGLNIIDLANIHSCCFIETEDCGKVVPGNGKKSVHQPFTVDGRISNTERRGCNMLIE